MKSEFVVLILVCLSIAFVTINSIDNNVKEIQTVIARDNLVTGEVTAISEEINDLTLTEYTTLNGMVISLGRVDNNGEEEMETVVSVPFPTKTSYYNLLLPADKSWTYAAINGITILPHTPMIIDPKRTAYYETGDQLAIYIEKDYDGVSEIEIYCDEPSIIIAGTPIRWYYNHDSDSLIISGQNHFKQIVIYFSRFDPKGTVFIEDTRNIEELSYRADKLETSYELMSQTLEPIAGNANNITNEVDELKKEKEDLIAETKEIKETIPKTNKTVENYEERISGNVTVASSMGVIMTIIALILIVVIIDVVFLSKRGKK